MTIERINTGKKGETLAESFLKKNGYKTIIKNYRTKQGEIDIIAKDKDCLCFIEVRTANTERFGPPEYTISHKKQDQISKAALLYIKRYGLENTAARFDVVCIRYPDSDSPYIKLFKNAFELNARYRY